MARSKWNRNIQLLWKKNGFPGIIECLDGTHIPICAPKESAASNVNRKGLNRLQWRLSREHDIYAYICWLSRQLPWCENTKKLGSLENWFKYLWPGPYCCRWSLSNSKMVTYTVQGQWSLNFKWKKNYNRLLSANRVTIEISFALLKERFLKESSVLLM